MMLDGDSPEPSMDEAYSTDAEEFLQVSQISVCCKWRNSRWSAIDDESMRSVHIADAEENSTEREEEGAEASGKAAGVGRLLSGVVQKAELKN